MDSFSFCSQFNSSSSIWLSIDMARIEKYYVNNFAFRHESLKMIGRIVDYLLRVVALC